MKKITVLLCVYFFLLSGVFAKDIRFIQVTDLKYSASDNNALFKDFVNEVNLQSDVSFVVFAGNNISNPSMKNLEGFIKEAKKIKKPFYVLIGDKDVNKHKGLSKVQYTSYLRKKVWRTHHKEDFNYTFEREGIVFMVVDGARDIVPTSIGYYKEDVLNWAEANLEKNSKKNIVILQHYPLISSDGKEVTFRPEKYMEILKLHKNVKAVVAGSKYENSEQMIDGVNHISTAPFPNYRVIDIIDTETNNPTIWAVVKEIKK